MKKYILLFFLIIFSTNLFSQNRIDKFIQINAFVDLLGNITMTNVERSNNKKANNIDTTINYNSINNLISKSKNSIEAINYLSNEGWLLVTALQLNKDDNGRPNSPFIAFYFRKE